MPDDIEATAENQINTGKTIVEVDEPEHWIYSNIASVSMSQMDVRIAFAEASPSGKAFTRIGIVLPPEHAAALALVLMRHVQVFEQKFGELRLKDWQETKARFKNQKQSEALPFSEIGEPAGSPVEKEPKTK